MRGVGKDEQGSIVLVLAIPSTVNSTAFLLLQMELGRERDAHQVLIQLVEALAILHRGKRDWVVPDDLRDRVVGLDPLRKDSGFLFRGTKRRDLKRLALQLFLAYW